MRLERKFVRVGPNEDRKSSALKTKAETTRSTEEIYRRRATLRT